MKRRAVQSSLASLMALTFAICLAMATIHYFGLVFAVVIVIASPPIVFTVVVRLFGARIANRLVEVAALLALVGLLIFAFVRR